MAPMRCLPLVAVALVAACGGASDFEHPADQPHQANAGLDWRDQVIYQIMVDRFENGDRNNDINVDPSIPGRYHGGDWQGKILYFTTICFQVYHNGCFDTSVVG